MRIGVSKKLLSGYAIMLLLLVTMGILMFITFDNVKKNAEALIGVENKTKVFSKVQFGSRNLLTVTDFIIGGNSWMYDYYFPETKLVNHQVEKFKRLPLNEHQKTALKQLEKEFSNLNKWTMLIVYYTEKKETKGPKWDNVLFNIDNNSLQIVKTLAILSGSLERELTQAIVNNDESIRAAKNSIIAIFLLSVLISLIVVQKANKIIIHPIQKLNDFTVRVAEGQLSKRVDITSNDEIGELASSFNIMVSQLQKSKEELLRSDEQHRLLFNNNPLPMLIYSLETLAILEVNQAMVNKYGYTREEFKDLSIKNLRPTEDIPMLIKAVEEARKGMNKKAEWRHRIKDGTIIIVDVSATSINYMEEEARMVVIHDITLKKKAEQELIRAKDLAEESVKSKELFLANMSHEIRTPLNAIIGMTRLLQKTKMNKKQLRYFSAVRNSAKHLLTIINDILDISKIESGELQFEAIGFKVDTVIDSLVKSIEHKTIEKDIYIHYEIDKAARQILIGDPVRLNQVLLNLLSNAVKFTSKGEVKLLCNVLNEGIDQLLLEFKIIDTGIGIPKEKMETIFESFKQVDASVTRKFGGTGLGLSISRNLVQLQGGDIFVESEEEKGSTFGFRLMYTKGDETDLPKEDKEVIDTQALSQTEVLLVEDNKVNQLMAATIMEEWNFKVDTAGDGKVAIEKLRDKKYDVVLMDIQMPVMGGIEATQIIRKEMPPDKSGVPIIAVTANALRGDKKKYLDAGMNDYLSKPFEPGSLYNKIAKLVKQENGKGYREPLPPSVEKPKPIVEDIPSEKLYDLSTLQNMSRGNDDFVLEMIQTFIETVSKSLVNFDEFMECQKWDRVSAVAHRMKPSLDLFGIGEIKNEIRLLEHYTSEKKNIEMIPELVGKLKRVCNKVMEGLQEEMKTLSR